MKVLLCPYFFAVPGVPAISTLFGNFLLQSATKCKHFAVRMRLRVCYKATRLPSSAKNASGPTAYAANNKARCALLGHANAPATSGRPCQLQNVCTREVTSRLRHERKTAAAMDPNAVVYNSWNATEAAALPAL